MILEFVEELIKEVRGVHRSSIERQELLLDTLQSKEKRAGILMENGQKIYCLIQIKEFELGKKISYASRSNPYIVQTIEEMADFSVRSKYKDIVDLTDQINYLYTYLNRAAYSSLDENFIG